MSTVLIIEDDQNLREGLELFFEIQGYDTLGTSNGLTGLELIRSEHPDIILTNYQMPGADGFHVLKTIREDSELADIPLVFLTADHQPSVREQALRDGADAFLTKPFTTEELSRTVVRLLSVDEQPKFM